MVHPARAFRSLNEFFGNASFAVGFRRPAIVLLVLAAMASLLATNGLTGRIALPAAFSWCFVPAAEVLALAAVTWRRRRALPLSILIDRFFAGHGTWTLVLIVASGILASVPPGMVWWLLTGPCLWAALLVIIWSAYVDYCFFRFVIGAGRAAAGRDVVVIRLMTWTVVVWIFAVPGATPWAVMNEIAEAVAAVMR
jgi:hypothetical protein